MGAISGRSVAALIGGVLAAQVALSAGAQDTVILSQRGDALTLDPYDENESPTFTVLFNLFDPLVDMDSELRLVPALAASWEQVSPTTWEFALRPGVEFHEGGVLGADDVVFSLNRLQTWEGSELKADISTVASVEAVGDLTVRIHTHQPDPILLNRLVTVLIMDRERTERVIAEHGERHLVEHPDGTGPYRLVEWVREDHLTLEAFPRHWGGAPAIPRVIFRPISNDATRLAALLTGDVHLITDVPVRDVERITSTPGLRLEQRPSLRVIYLGVDCGRDATPGVPSSPPNPLRDRRVREAIYLAINEDLIVERIMNGFAVPAAQLVPPVIFGYDPSITRPPHNVERARELLAEAGYPDGFAVRLDAPNDRYVNDARIAQAVAGQLARIGIRVDVQARPKAIFFEDEQQGRCSFFLIGWTNPNGDASGTFEYLLHTRQPERGLGVSNYSSHYSNPELDALTEQAMRTLDRAERERILQRAMRLAMEDLPHIPLHFQVDLYGVSERLEWSPRADTRLRGADMRFRPAAQ